MAQTTGTIDDFGMDTITLAGSLENKLQAMRDAGFSQVMLKANDLVGHPQGWRAAVQAVRSSGLRGTGFKTNLPAATGEVTHRRRQQHAPLAVGQAFGHAAAHSGHQRVRGSEVYAHGNAALVRVGRLAGF